MKGPGKTTVVIAAAIAATIVLAGCGTSPSSHSAKGSKASGSATLPPPPPSTSGFSLCNLDVSITRSSPLVSMGSVTISEAIGSPFSQPDRMPEFTDPMPCGHTVTLSETPATQASFVHWVVSGDAGQFHDSIITGSRISFPFDGDTGVTAVFQPSP